MRAPAAATLVRPIAPQAEPNRCALVVDEAASNPAPVPQQEFGNGLALVPAPSAAAKHNDPAEQMLKSQSAQLPAAWDHRSLGSWEPRILG